MVEQGYNYKWWAGKLDWNPLEVVKDRNGEWTQRKLQTHLQKTLAENDMVWEVEVSIHVLSIVYLYFFPNTKFLPLDSIQS